MSQKPAAQSAPQLLKSGSLTIKERMKLHKSQDAYSIKDLDFGPRGRKDQTDNTVDPKEKSDELQAELEQVAHTLEKQAFHIIFNIFPAKITKLDAMYKRDPRFSKNAEEIKNAGPLPSLVKTEATVLVEKPKQMDTAVPCNKTIVELCEALKDEMLLLGEYMSSLSLWIQLNVPRLSDNVQFSQEVQMELLQQIQGAEEVSSSVLDTFAGYYLTRAELVVSTLKYPGVEDYRRAIIELDEKTYIKITLVAAQVRTLYLVLFDLLSKNLATLLLDPNEKNAAAQNMYY